MRDRQGRPVRERDTFLVQPFEEGWAVFRRLPDGSCVRETGPLESPELAERARERIAQIEAPSGEP